MKRRPVLWMIAVTWGLLLGPSVKAQSTPAGSPAAQALSGSATGTGIVKGVDKAAGKVKVAHDPIKSLNWPKMTMSFPVKDPAVLDQLKEGQQVRFEIEKTASGYVITKITLLE